jgi:cobalt/nickel transport system ATP-binding protein
MWRYMGITVDEAGRMLRARTARSSILASAGSKTGGKLAWRAKVTGGMAGSLLVRSIERSERVYAAMLSRGYDGARPEFDVEKKYDTSRQVNQTEPGETANTNKYPDVEVKDIFYQYPDGRNALRGVSLQINTGEKVALLGMNGAGKSTLLWHLNGLLPGEHDDNSSGLVRIQGIVVVEPSLKRVRAMVGLVFQNPDDQLFSPTVYDDVAYSSIHQGLPAGVIAGRVDAALRGVGMEEFSSRVPYHLSTGEKKRIAIATVLASDPAVLVLDEPTAGLDPYARRGVMELLEQLPQTMLAATHDLDFAARVLPRSIILYQGRVVADGLTLELMKDRQLLETYCLV